MENSVNKSQSQAAGLLLVSDFESYRNSEDAEYDEPEIKRRILSVHTDQDKVEVVSESREEGNTSSPKLPHLHLQYQNSPEDILSITSPSSGSDWSPNNSYDLTHDMENHGGRIDSLRVSSNLRAKLTLKATKKDKL